VGGVSSPLSHANRSARRRPGAGPSGLWQRRPTAARAAAQQQRGVGPARATQGGGVASGSSALAAARGRGDGGAARAGGGEARRRRSGAVRALAGLGGLGARACWAWGGLSAARAVRRR